MRRRISGTLSHSTIPRDTRNPAHSSPWPAGALRGELAFPLWRRRALSEGAAGFFSSIPISRSRGVCFGVGRFMARSIRHWAEASPTSRSLDDQREAVRPVEPAAREQSHASSLPANHQAVAVVLDLVHPIAPHWSMTRPGRDAGRDEGQRKRAAGEHWPSLIVPAPGVEDRRRSGCGR